MRVRATHVSPDVSSNLGAQTDASQVGLSAATLYGSSDAKLEVAIMLFQN